MSGENTIGKEEVKTLVNEIGGTPKRREIFGSFTSFSFGLVWVVPNVRDTDMLTTFPANHFLEKKIFYSVNLEKMDFSGLANEFNLTVELYKIENCNDVHLRAISTDDYKDCGNENGPMLTPDDLVFSASIINERGEAIQDEKSSRSRMPGYKRFWIIQSFIRSSEFDKEKLLTSSAGDLHLRLTFNRKIVYPLIKTIISSEIQTAVTNDIPAESSKANTNLNEKVGKSSTTEDLIRTRQEEDIGAPKIGEICQLFSSFNTGMVCLVPNVKDTDMLTTIPVYHLLDGKIFYSLNLEKEKNEFGYATSVELYKTENCSDVHLRAIEAVDDYKDDDELTIISDDLVFSASIINEQGDIIQAEKICRSHMSGGKRIWNIQSFINSSEFDKDKLLTSSGDLHLRITFNYNINDKTTESSKTNALKEKVTNCATVENLIRKGQKVGITFPKCGGIFELSKFYNFGIVCLVPNVHDTDMLTTIPTYLEKKIFYSFNGDKESAFTTVELYKTENCSDVHLRAIVDVDDYNDDDVLTSDQLHFVFSASIVNEQGDTIQDEKICRSHMLGGKRIWNIQSFIYSSEFDKEKLLTSSGDLYLRISISDNNNHNDITAETSNTNANLNEKGEKYKSAENLDRAGQEKVVGVPKCGEILELSCLGNVGMVCSVPNVRDTDMFTTILAYHLLEEKIFYSLNSETEKTCNPNIELYKTHDCSDVHLRAIEVVDDEDDEDDEDDYNLIFTSGDLVFSASIINEQGDTIQDEKICRSHMSGGKRIWNIHSFINSSEFDKDRLLTSSSDLHLRITFNHNTNDKTAESSKTNALNEKVTNCATVENLIRRGQKGGITFPKCGGMFELSNFSNFGIVCSVPNVRDTDMLTTIPTYLEEKIFYSFNADKEEFIYRFTTVELYKTENCSDVHLRAIVDVDDYKDDNELTSDHFVFSASIINDQGDTIQDEKICRSHMLGGKRIWNIQSFIYSSEFDKDKLLNSSGHLHLRMAFNHNNNHNDIIAETSNTNANLNEKVEKCKSAENLNRAGQEEGIGVPKCGEILELFCFSNVGMVCLVPNVRDTDMFTTILAYHLLEEKIFYSLNSETGTTYNPNIELYKTDDCSDVHLRATEVVNDEDDYNLIFTPGDLIFSASIINEQGDTIQDEKICRSYMSGGKRIFNIKSFIHSSEFDKDKLLTSGDLQLHITYNFNTNDKTAESSITNANLNREVAKCSTVENLIRKGQEEDTGIPKCGEILELSSFFNLEMVCLVPNVRDTNMLTTIPEYHLLKEKIFYSFKNQIEKSDFPNTPTVELYKTENCSDVHLRAFQAQDDYNDDDDEDELEVFNASIINERGDIIQAEKICRSHMSGGKRIWNIQSFIYSSEFDKDKLLTSSGDLQLRIGFNYNMVNPLIKSIIGSETQTAAVTGE